MELTSERIKTALTESKAIEAKKNSFDRHYYWFNYWEISPSLWEKRLQEIPQGTSVFIPIHWGLHAIKETKVVHYDFGKYRSDCDLKKIEDLALSFELKPVFCVPMTPVPFLTNGGLPDWMECPQAESKNKIAINVLSKDGKIKKVPSFYHPQIFKHYKEFLYSLGRTFAQKGFSTKIRGVMWGRTQDGQFESFLEDNSEMFEMSYKRFLERNSQFESNQQSRNDFKKLLRSLLEQVAYECLESYWDGVIRIDLWGSSEKDFFQRVVNQSHTWDADLWHNFFYGLSNNILPCDYLFDNEEIPLVLRQALKDLVDLQYLSHFTGDANISERSNTFKPLVTTSIHSDNIEIAEQTGLTTYLNSISPYCFELQEIHEWNFDEEDSLTHFFFADQLEIKDFKSALRLVMAGNKVVLDIGNMSEEQKRVLELFILENNLRGELIESMGLVGFYPFGDGKLITVEASAFQSADEDEKHEFWHRIYRFLGVHHLEMDSDEGLMTFDMKRDVSPFELKYEEVRRTAIYNPTSKTLHLAVPHSRYFAFIRYGQQRGADIKSSPSGVSVSLAPQGSITLDFGYVGKHDA